jgi:macrolide-specific efflux system membrane fusion protein
LGLPASGQVAEVNVRPGSVVKMGAVLARLADSATTLVAPFDGVILDVMIRQGESVLAGQSLMLLANPKALEVQATVIEEDLPLVAVGQRVELFFDAQPELATPGHVSRIVPQRVPHEDRPLYHVYMTLDEPVEGVVAGMTADAAIIIAEAKNVLRLPRAIVRAGSGDTAQVQVWANGQASERTVRLGLRSNIYVEILAGLREGEEVIGQ